MEIFVGNLPFDITEQDIRDTFEKYGAISNVKMLSDKFTGRFRGIAFVTLDDDAAAQKAIDEMNGADLGGRPMRLDRTRPKEERFSGFGGGFTKKPPFRGNGGFRPRRTFGGEGGDRQSEGGDRPQNGFRPRSGGFRKPFNRDRSDNNGDGFRPKRTFRPRRDFDSREDSSDFGDR